MNDHREAAAAQKLIREIVQTGTVTYSRPHAIERMRQRDMSMVDVTNVLQRGRAKEAEMDGGKWRHQVVTGRMVVVVQILTETSLLIVTAWRLK